jgi:hypothetical protein
MTFFFYQNTDSFHVSCLFVILTTRSGKKVALIERLKEYETSQSSTSRSLSSSAIAHQSQKNKPDEPVPDVPKVEVASGVEANIINLAEIEVPEVEPALAPGLPEAKTDLDEAPPTLDIKMPEFEDAPRENALPVSSRRVCEIVS